MTNPRRCLDLELRHQYGIFTVESQTSLEREKNCAREVLFITISCNSTVHELRDKIVLLYLLGAREEVLERGFQSC